MHLKNLIYPQTNLSLNLPTLKIRLPHPQFLICNFIIGLKESSFLCSYLCPQNLKKVISFHIRLIDGTDPIARAVLSEVLWMICQIPSLPGPMLILRKIIESEMLKNSGSQTTPLCSCLFYFFPLSMCREVELEGSLSFAVAQCEDTITLLSTAAWWKLYWWNFRACYLQRSRQPCVFSPKDDFINHPGPGLLPWFGWTCFSPVISALIWRRKCCQRSQANRDLNPETFISQVAVFGRCCRAELRQSYCISRKCKLSAQPRPQSPCGLV